ncbi:MAG: DEAD/DEAH box helicase [Desulforudis sp.]|jgi:SNF2 family DNA or RNA helicase|nr:MAG: DEAD/DEAH box helicase [Desulforudis sp.]
MSKSKIKLLKEPVLLAKHSAFDFQAKALDEIRNLEYAAIFHEQGLGKTKIAIDLFLYWLEQKIVDTVLVVAKKSLVPNWRLEVENHTYLKPHLLAQDRKKNYFVFNSAARLILTSYEVIKSELKRFELFLKTRPVGVILDESTKIKNPDSALSKAFYELAPLFERRVILTGTPSSNRPYDMWGQIYFLDLGKALGKDFKAFKKNTDLSADVAENLDSRESFESSVSGIYKKVRGFSVRETKDSGVIELPAKKYSYILTDWEPRQFDIYRRIREEYKAVFLKDGSLIEDISESVLKRLTRLVQAASNPFLFDLSYTLIPGKYEPLQDLLSDIARRKEKCIIWTSFIANVEWLVKNLKDFHPKKIHGKMPIEARYRSIANFLKLDECPLLIATPASAKEGLTLTAANNIIYFDRSLSLDDYLQSQDRIHRISQERECNVNLLMMKDSIDEWVDVLLKEKHLSAQLAQGDISLDYFRSQMTYSYKQILDGILNL